MQSRYPSTLFHFTNDKQALISILDGSFKLSHAKERIKGPSAEAKFGAPMVSFCDLRLSELRTHMKHYGYYGLGMSKAWARKKGLNTVYYVSDQSSATDNFIKGINFLFDHRGTVSVSHTSAFNEHYMNLLNMYRFMKNYEGDNKKLKVKRFRFADEREWRFVPPIGTDFSNLKMRPFRSWDELDTSEKKRLANNVFDDVRLRFKPRDISYIIVKSEGERDEIIEHVFNAKSGAHGVKERKRLASRILTSKQIKDDV